MSEHDDEATKECVFCLAEVPAAATRCRYCTGDFAQPVTAPTLAGFWVIGIVLVFIGVSILAGDDEDSAWIGFLFAGAGGVLMQIATIAWGVSVGMRDRDERMQIQRLRNVTAATEQTT